MCESANGEVQRDDGRLRVTLWSLPAKSETGWHVHEYDYVVVPVLGGMLTVENDSGRNPYPIEAGKSYSRPAGVKHNVINDTGEEIAFVEIELKA